MMIVLFETFVFVRFAARKKDAAGDAYMYRALSKRVFKWCCFLAMVTFDAGCTKESPGNNAVQPALGFVTAQDGVPIRYEVLGAGKPAVVFVHGWSCDRSYWHGQLESFSRKFRVVTVDLAGHGESGVTRDEWTVESFGGDVATVVKELGLDRVVLVGHSMGGDVITAAAGELQDRVDGLVWVDTVKQLGSPISLEQVQQFVKPFRADFPPTTASFVRRMFPPGADESLVDWVVTDMSSAHPKVALGALEATLTYRREITTPLSKLQLPVVAINPDDSPTDIESMALHGVEVVIMPGVGHFLMMEQPDDFNAMLMDVIEKFSD